MSSLSRNTFFSLLNQIISVAVPFLTFPYVSRILGPENYGTLNYALTIITLFGVFGGIGLLSYATREVAKNRNNVEETSKTFIEIFIIQSILTLIVFVIYLFFIIYNNEIDKYFLLFLVTGFTLFTNLFTFQWFFMGTEDFKYITTRDGFIKISFVIMIFLFVRDSNDMVLYVILNLISLLISALVNSFFIIKRIQIKKYSFIFKPHLKPVLLALIMSFISTLTIQLNAVLLGSIASKENLGYYNVGLKITTLTVNIISSALVVLLPRLSYLNESNDTNAQSSLMKKTSDLLMLFSIPAAVGLFLYSEQIITLIFGVSYNNAIIVSKITAVCLIVMPLIGIMYNLVYSKNKEAIAIYTMIISLIINIGLNVILVPKYLYIGAAISFVIVELSKLIIYSLFMKKLKFEVSLFTKKKIHYFASSLIVFIAPYLLIKPSTIISTFLLIIISAICYFILLLILKDPYCMFFLNLFKDKVFKRGIN